MNNTAIAWFRNDLRLADNPALTMAAAHNRPIVPLFILEENVDDPWPIIGAARWRLHQSLAALAGDIAALGGRLILRRGRPAEILLALAAETGAQAVYWNRRYEPAAIARDAALKTALKAQGLSVETFNGALLFEPWEIKTGGGKTGGGGPYKVF
ncbi:MAG TPA: deoxyribodipyrimidine photo-lyase, partial [Azospirillaceae bacterium]|nr:deoxyribodipyrimidine photo-lyase [Azospirillaceae bacterium]